MISKLLVAVPTTGGIMKSKTAESLFRLCKVLTNRSIDVYIQNLDSSDVVTARNYYSNLVYNSGRLDGLLFVDSDMRFKPLSVLRMLRFAAPISSLAYTKKSLDLSRVAESYLSNEDIDRAISLNAEFNVLYKWDAGDTASMTTRGNFLSVAAVGMGCCLIARSALHEMVESGVVPQRKDVRNRKEYVSFGFFDYARHDGVTLGEDFSFCHRWTHQMGRRLWLSMADTVGHIGDFEYRGAVSDVIRLAGDGEGAR